MDVYVFFKPTQSAKGGGLDEWFSIKLQAAIQEAKQPAPPIINS